MTWLALIKLLLGLASTLLTLAQKRLAIREGEAKVIAESLERSLDLLSKAEKARADALAEFDKRGMPDDNDPNLRD